MDRKGLGLLVALLGASLLLVGVGDAQAQNNLPTAPARAGFTTQGFPNTAGMNAPTGYKFVRISCPANVKSFERRCTWKLIRKGGGGGTFGKAVVPRDAFGCTSAEFYYGGKCMKRSKLRSWARNSSRLFVMKKKVCPPGFPYRQAKYCYVCPVGRYWNTGGTCVSTCPRGKTVDSLQRKCRFGGGGGGRVGGQVPNQGNMVCPSNKFYYGGRCRLRSKLRSWARTSSKLFTMRNKPCPPGFPFRTGTNCFVCPVGKYWNKGGICTRRCGRFGINFAARKCKTSRYGGGSANSRNCPAGQYYYGGKCSPNSKFRRWARTSSRLFTARGKACPPGFPFRLGTQCYVCPSGKFWLRGGRCVRTCSRGKDFTKRMCKSSRSGTSYKPRYQTKKGKCPAGSIRDGNKCFSCRAGCHYIGGGKCRCPRR